MSPRLALAAALGLCVVDQLDASAALVELPDRSLQGFGLECLPPAPQEGERLACEPAPRSACGWTFLRLPPRQAPPGGAPPSS